MNIIKDFPLGLPCVYYKMGETPAYEVTFAISKLSLHSNESNIHLLSYKNLSGHSYLEILDEDKYLYNEIEQIVDYRFFENKEGKTLEAGIYKADLHIGGSKGLEDSHIEVETELRNIKKILDY